MEEATEIHITDIQRLEGEIVRVVGDTGCERIHKEKKVQRAKFFIFTFPREGKG